MVMFCNIAIGYFISLKLMFIVKKCRAIFKAGLINCTLCCFHNKGLDLWQFTTGMSAVDIN